ncbi:MAG: hypothetical protein IKI29_03510 [Clostridia bacterium]|nr:hypothetical protein [Clostridia bacterium]
MADNTFLTFRGKPLVRKGNEIYYGDMAEKFIVRFEFLSGKKNGEADINSEVKVQLLDSNIELPMADRVKKESVKSTLFDALDVGFVWLERALA